MGFEEKRLPRRLRPKPTPSQPKECLSGSQIVGCPHRRRLCDRKHAPALPHGRKKLGPESSIRSPLPFCARAVRNQDEGHDRTLTTIAPRRSTALGHARHPRRIHDKPSCQVTYPVLLISGLRAAALITHPRPSRPPNSPHPSRRRLASAAARAVPNARDRRCRCPNGSTPARAGSAPARALEAAAGGRRAWDSTPGRHVLQDPQHDLGTRDAEEERQSGVHAPDRSKRSPGRQAGLTSAHRRCRFRAAHPPRPITRVR